MSGLYCLCGNFIDTDEEPEAFGVNGQLDPPQCHTCRVECGDCDGTGGEPSGTSHGGVQEILECGKCGGTGVVP